MASYTFPDPRRPGVTITVTGPVGFTREQATAVFDQQSKTGSLVGVSQGAIVNADIQAIQGLRSARATVTQNQSGIIGALGPEIPGATGRIGSVNSASPRGAAPLDAAGSIVEDLQSGSFLGAIDAVQKAGVNFNTFRNLTLSSVLGPAVVPTASSTFRGEDLRTITRSEAVSLGARPFSSTIPEQQAEQPALFAGAVPDSVARLRNAGLLRQSPRQQESPSRELAAPVRNQLLKVNSQTALASINQLNRRIVSTNITDPVDIVDYAKQPPALTSIEGLQENELTGVLAQVKKTVNQPSNAVSDSQGVGSYGLDITQLEQAGIIKPGVSMLAKNSSPTEILNSPSIYTGKDNIKSLDDLLQNTREQEKIQQELMSTGVNSLQTVGIPTSALSAQGLAGVAVSAAKSVAGTEAILKSLPLPGEVPSDFVNLFNNTIRNSAYAVNLSENKIPLPFKAETVPVPATNTVARVTVDAASARIIGNDKVPEPKYTA